MQICQGQEHLCQQPPHQALAQARTATAQQEIVQVAIAAVLHHQRHLISWCSESTQQSNNERMARSLQNLTFLLGSRKHVLR
eukprot:Skav201502  [mRNA]  locus=scaffold1154:235340:247533:- [translate_table: standard]